MSWLSRSQTQIAILGPFVVWLALIVFAYLRGYRPNRTLLALMIVGAIATMNTTYWGRTDGLHIYPAGVLLVIVWFLAMRVIGKGAVVLRIVPWPAAVGVGAATFASMLAADVYMGGWKGAISGVSGWQVADWFGGIGGAGLGDAMLSGPIISAVVVYACFKVVRVDTSNAQAHLLGLFLKAMNAPVRWPRRERQHIEVGETSPPASAGKSKAARSLLLH